MKPMGMKSISFRDWQDDGYLLAAMLCLLTTLVALPLRGYLDTANIDMLFLLTTFVVAVWLGRGPAVLAAVLGTGLFDYFFVPPYFSFAVADAQYLVTLVVMLAIGLLSAQLAARLAERTEEAGARERETQVLYRLAGTLGRCQDSEQIVAATRHFLDDIHLDGELLTDAQCIACVDQPASFPQRFSRLERSFARSTFERDSIVEVDTLADMNIAILFLPLRAADRVVGVLAVGPVDGDSSSVRALRPLLEAFASLLGGNLDRLQATQAARESALRATEERLRTSILAALSHDLRTPLTSLIGLADTLVQERRLEDARVVDIATIIGDQARAMHRMLSNLLDMARLQTGNVALNRAWQPFDEVIGSSIRLLGGLLADRPLNIKLAPELPLIWFDAVLLERVICNLLENAVKYSPAGSAIGIQAQVRADQRMLEVAIDNDGAGFPPQRLNDIFEIFARGHDEMTVGGTGLGLAIARTIVTAHDGHIEAINRPGGATVRFALPLGTPPALPTLADEEAA